MTPLSHRCDRCKAPYSRVTCARCMVRDLAAFWCVLLGALAFVALVTAYGDRATWSDAAAPSAPRCSP